MSEYTPFKMKGFSGFQSSPAKQAPEKKQKGPVEKVNRDRKLEEQIGDIGDKINDTGEDLFQERISKEEHDARVRILRAKEKVAITENRRKQGLGPEKK